MPELPICEICMKVIVRADEDYVVTNKHEAQEKYWMYRHKECHEQTYQKATGGSVNT
jgi:hypothetical protein